MAKPKSRMTFVNLPVKDLKRAVDFFTALGFTFNQQFTDETATCMIVSEDSLVMLLVESRFKEFTKKAVANAGATTEVIMGISADSREEVDAIVNKALSAGGKPANDPMDHGFMYGWSFQDPDDHLWEVIWMDPAAVAPTS